MRRAERLFQLVQLVRGRRLSTAAYIAERLGVSVRSVYRDVADLSAQGVPIEGEPGVGYRMRPGFDLPPLMFSTHEAQALVAAVRLMQPRLDPTLAAHADTALSKVLSVLPASARAAAEALALFAPPGTLDELTRERLDTARRAIDARRKLQMAYADSDGRTTERVVRPLACVFWGNDWTLAAWCELRQDFRSFRLDRLRTMAVLEDRFRDEAGRSLPDLFRHLQAQGVRGIPAGGVSL